jgi:hypothetical protein
VRNDSGQASLEYIVLLVISTLVVGGGAMAVKGEGLAASVLAQFARGICVVGGGDCERDRAPCVIGSQTTSQDLVVVVAVIRLAGGRTIVRQRSSDGTELVTLVESGGAGLELTAGGSISVGGAEYGAAASGSFSGRIARGRAWTVPSAVAAERLIAQLAPAAAVMAGRGRSPMTPPRRSAAAPPPADITFGASGLSSIIGGRLAAAGISFEAEDLVGERLDHRTGQRTLTIARRNELLADLSPLPASGLEGGLRHSELYTLTLDRAGNPIDLGVFDARRFHAGAKLPGAVSALVPGVGNLPLRQGMLVEVEQHLDLNNAASRAVATAFIAALRGRGVGFGPAAEVSEALKARINSDGVTLVRSYGIEGRRSGFGGKLGAGVGLAGNYQRSVENATLLDARVRGIDQNWRARSDCLHAS